MNHQCFGLAPRSHSPGRPARSQTIYELTQKTALLLSILAAQSALATTTFTVTNTLSSGAGSLNEAMAQANSAIGTNTIAFNIPGSGVHTIVLTNPLPAIIQPVIIDGYTQPGASPNTLAMGDNAVILIKIDGTAVSPIMQLCRSSLCGGIGSSDGSTIRGLCFVKTGGATMLDIRSHTNLLAGNFIGVDTDGITLAAASAPVFVGFGTRGNTIGSPSPADRNVIATSAGWGLILNDGDDTVVQGNYLGVDATGTASLGAGDWGVNVELGSGCTIGGSAPGAGNVINARVTGVQLGAACLSCAVGGNTVQGNFIGTDATGTVPFHTLFRSVLISTSDGTIIGGSTAGAANVLSAPGDGILIQGSPTGLVVQGNKIGTDMTGTLPLGNGSCGIEILAASTSGTIGGTNAGEGNIIAFSGQNGISIANGDSGWSILGNSIHDNARLGITLFSCGANTPTPNDPCDTDTGGNNHQNYPIITGVSLTPGIVTLSGTLNSSSNTTYRLEFFGNPSCDPSGFGQGTVFLGATNVSTVNCDATFAVTFPDAGQFSAFTATATDSDGNTSEFSPCAVPIAVASPALTIQRVPPDAVRLLWPTNPSGFNLEFNTNLATANWQSASPAPVIVGTNNVVTNTTTSPQQFYRVKK